MRKILVVGAGGYIGSAITSALSDGKDMKVIGFGHDKNLPILKSIVPDIEFISGDITDKASLKKALVGVDGVVHTVSLVGNRACTDAPWEAIKVGIHGTFTLLSAIKSIFPKDFPLVLHISTQSVYGTFAKRPMPLREDMEVVPDDLYGAIKMEQELLLRELNPIILRLTNVYGYGTGIGHEKNVVTKFIKSAKEKSAVTLFGDGSQGIDFIHVNDVADVVGKIFSMKGISRGAYNVGGGKATSIKEVAEAIVSIAKEKKLGPVEIIQEKAPADKIWPDRWVSNDKLKKNYKWSPKISIEKGVFDLFEYYKK